jgi:chromosome segregation ATPase
MHRTKNKSIGHHEAQKSQLMEALKNMESEKNETKKQLESLYIDVNHWKSQHEILAQQQLLDKDEQFRAHIDQHRKVLDELNVEKLKTNELNQHIAHLGEQNSHLTEKLTNLSSENEKYRAQLEHTSKLYAQLQTEHQEAVAKIYEAIPAIEAWKAQNAQLQGENESLRLTQANLETQFQHQREDDNQRIQFLEQKLTKLHQEGQQLINDAFSGKAQTEAEKKKTENALNDLNEQMRQMFEQATQTIERERQEKKQLKEQARLEWERQQHEIQQLKAQQQQQKQ